MKGKEQEAGGEMAQYRNDVRTIREILVSVEKRPIFENWVFYTWGGLLLIGAALYYVGFCVWGLDAAHEFLLVWLPVIAVGGALEAVSYVRNARRESLRLFSRDFVGIAAGLIGGTAVLIFLVIILYRAGVPELVSTVLLLGLAVSFFLFGQHPSYTHLFYFGYAMLAVALALYLVGAEEGLNGLLAGIGAGISLIVVGVVGGRALHTV